MPFPMFFLLSVFVLVCFWDGVLVILWPEVTQLLFLLPLSGHYNLLVLILSCLRP